MGPSDKLDKRNQVYPADWFPLVPTFEGQPTVEQQALIAEGRDLFAALRPARAQNTYAVLYGGLVLVVPLDRHEGPLKTDRGSLHTSLQLNMRVKGGAPVMHGKTRTTYGTTTQSNPTFKSPGTIATRGKQRSTGSCLRCADRSSDMTSDSSAWDWVRLGDTTIRNDR